MTLRIGAGGPFLVPSQVDPAPSIPSDDPDSWWAGTAQCFANVATAAAATLVSTSLLAASIHQQNEELFPSAQGQAEMGTSAPPTQRARIAPVFLKWDQQDDLPVVSTFYLPEDEPPRLDPPLNSLAVVLWAVDEEIVPQATFRPEEDYWLRLERPAVPAFLQVWQDSDLFESFALAEDEWQAPQIPARAAAVVLPWADDDFIAPTGNFGIGEEDWQIVTAKQIPPIVSQWTDQDDLPRVQFLPEDDWQSPPPPLVKPFVQAWVDTDFVGTVVTLGLAEEDWLPPAPTVPKPIAAFWVDGDAVPTPATPTPFEEDWLPPPARAVAPLVTVWDQPDELPRFFAGEDDWQSPPAPLVKPFAQVWVDSDYAPPPAPFGLAEEDWITPTPLPPAPVVRVWHDEIRNFPTPTISVDEVYWQAPFWIRQAIVAPLFTVDEDGVPSAVVVGPFVPVGGNDRIGSRTATANHRIGSKTGTASPRVGSKTATASRRIGSKKA